MEGQGQPNGIGASNAAVAERPANIQPESAGAQGPKASDKSKPRRRWLFSPTGKSSLKKNSNAAASIAQNKPGGEVASPVVPAPQASETSPEATKPTSSTSTEADASSTSNPDMSRPTARPAIIPETSSISLSTPTGVETARTHVKAALGEEGVKVLGGEISPEELKVALEALRSAEALVSSGNQVNQEGLSRLLQGAIQKERLQGMAAKMADQQRTEELQKERDGEANRLLMKMDLGLFKDPAHNAITAALEVAKYEKKEGKKDGEEKQQKTLEEIKKEADDKETADKRYQVIAIRTAVDEYEAAAGRKNPTREPLSTYERQLIEKYVLRGEGLSSAIRHATRGNIWRELIPAFFKAVFKNIMKDTSSGH